jgi:membrane-bound metal-dependent hydrolase YbcI (DUF457 family)
LGALLPDLDASHSKIKHLKLLGTQFKPFLLPALIVNRTDRHRGLLHSLWGLVFVAIVVSPLALWLSWTPVVALLTGYGSHLAADAMTKTGIRLLYSQPERFYLLPAKWRITTGSSTEEALLLPLALSVTTLLLQSVF